MHKKLTKSRTDKALAGVCGGIAEYFSLDPLIVRLGYAAFVIGTGFVPGLLLYVIAAVVIPEGSVITPSKPVNDAETL